MRLTALRLESKFLDCKDESIGAEKEEIVFENFSQEKLKIYIKDPLYSVLLNCLFSKFGEYYKKQMHPKARKKI